MLDAEGERVKLHLVSITFQTTMLKISTVYAQRGRMFAEIVPRIRR